MIYNKKRDEIIISASGGCKAWKLMRTYVGTSNVFNLHVCRTYLRCKKGSSQWISYMDLDEKTQRLICIEDDTVKFIDCETGKKISVLSNIHDAPVTGCIWYNRSHYFVTSCSAGKVKVWAVHHDTKTRYGKNEYALLHTFTGHTKSVTALKLHPLPGLAISASLDGSIRLINLEAMQEIYVLYVMQPIILMASITMGDLNLCVGATDDGTIKVWSMNDFLGFFGVCRAVCQSFIVGECGAGVFWGSLRARETLHHHHNYHAMCACSLLSTAACHGAKLILHYHHPHCEFAARDPDPQKARMAAVISAGEDIRLFSHTGKMMSSLIPGEIDGDVLCMNYSISTSLLLIMHTTRRGSRRKIKKNSTIISVFDAENVSCTLAWQFEDPAATVEGDKSAAMQLIDFSPAEFENYKKRKFELQRKENGLNEEFNAKSMMETLELNTKIRSSRHREGCKAGVNDEQTLVFGSKTGSLIFVRVSQTPEIIFRFKSAHECAIWKVEFCKGIGRLVTFGFESDGVLSMKVWELPEMRLIYTIPLKNKLSVVEFSVRMPICACGYEDGQVQLIELNGRQPKEVVNSHTLEQHSTRVCSLAFCDIAKVYCSCSIDGQVKIWDLGNRLLDRVILNKPPTVCFFSGHSSNIVLSQGAYLLMLRKETWMPPGGKKALMEENTKLAIMKLQARFRGSKARLSMTDNRVLDYMHGDDKSNDDFTGALTS